MKPFLTHHQHQQKILWHQLHLSMMLKRKNVKNRQKLSIWKHIKWVSKKKVDCVYLTPYSVQAVPYKTSCFDSEKKTIWHLCYPVKVEIWTSEVWKHDILVCQHIARENKRIFSIRLFQQAYFDRHALGAGRVEVLYYGAPHEVSEEADDGGNGPWGQVHHNAAGPRRCVRVCLHLLPDVRQVQLDSG